jgi:hypothetical protein
VRSRRNKNKFGRSFFKSISSETILQAQHRGIIRDAFARTPLDLAADDPTSWNWGSASERST